MAPSLLAAHENQMLMPSEKGRNVNAAHGHPQKVMKSVQGSVLLCFLHPGQALAYFLEPLNEISEGARTAEIRVFSV